MASEKMSRRLVVAVGIAYGVVGLATLAPVVQYLFFPPTTQIASRPWNFYLSPGIFIFVPALLISYGLVKFKRWARRLLIAYNGCLLAVILGALWIGSGLNPRPLEPSVLVFAIILVLAGLIALFLRKDARDLTLP